MRFPFLLAALAALLLAAPASAQHVRPERIWDLVLGSPVADLPPIFFDMACGTAGGPASRPLASLAEFARCPANAAGLHEVAFRYDDTEEFVARARRDDQGLRNVLINTIEGQPVILSLLIDASGILKGYRIYTDPKADPETRMQAFSMVNYIRPRYGLSGWSCENRPQDAREAAVDGLYVNSTCARIDDGIAVAIESRFYRKPGQREFDVLGNPTVNEFESWSRAEVLLVVPRTVPSPSPQPTEATADPQTPEARFLAGSTTGCPGCQLAGADLRRRNLSGANLSGADLAGALLHRADLRRANLSGANLTGANLNLADLTSATLTAARLDRALLYSARLDSAVLEGATLTFALCGLADFSQAHMGGAILDDADLGDARLVRTDLRGAQLRRVFAFGASMLDVRLDKARADRANFAGTVMDRASLAGGDFTSADFLGAHMVEANLSGANFTDARLTLANLFGARREGADFTRALLP